MTSLTPLLVLSGLIAVVVGYPTSVPPSSGVCSKMTPNHGANAQTSSAPYALQVSGSGKNYQITLSGKGSATFKGFYLQARDTQGNRVGTFVADDKTVKVHGCRGIKDNAAHHAINDVKNKVVVNWKAPQAYTGTVTFQATFVQQYENFWTGVRSESVSIKA